MSVRRHELRRYPWQVRDSGQLLLVVAAGVWLVASVAQTAANGLQDPRIAVAFGALIAFGEVLRLNLPGDRETAPIGFAGALAYALLIRVGSHVSQHTAQQVVTVATIGMIIGALPHLAVGRPARVSGMATRLLCVACVAYIFRPLAGRYAVVHHWGLAFALMASLAVLALCSRRCSAPCCGSTSSGPGSGWHWWTRCASSCRWAWRWALRRCSSRSRRR